MQHVQTLPPHPRLSGWSWPPHEEAHFTHSFPGSCSSDPDPNFRTTGEGWNVGEPVNPELCFRLNSFFTTTDRINMLITEDYAPWSIDPLHPQDQDVQIKWNSAVSQLKWNKKKRVNKMKAALLEETRVAHGPHSKHLNMLVLNSVCCSAMQLIDDVRPVILQSISIRTVQEFMSSSPKRQTNKQTNKAPLRTVFLSFYFDTAAFWLWRQTKLKGCLKWFWVSGACAAHSWRFV